MKAFLILLLIALIASSIGFKKYVYFISLGYGFSISAIGITLLLLFSKELTVGTVLLSALLIIYGIRLSGYLALREIKSASYNKKMKKEIKDGKGMSFTAKSAIWITSALLYACETAPVLFRLNNRKGTDVFAIIGLIIMVIGLSLETIADLQKNKAKKINPNRFVDTGLFKLVRCPNYLGEMIFWTGVLFSGLNVLNSFAAWLLSLIAKALSCMGIRLMIPALFTRMSICPNSLRMFATISSTSASLVTSVSFMLCLVVPADLK